MGRRILITGATGYVGGRLVRRLLDRGHSVRCLVRDRERLIDRPWEREVDVAIGDALDFDSLRAAMEGVEIAYYFIDPLNAAGRNFAEQTRAASYNFGRAAKISGIERIIYLGTIRPKAVHHSEYLRSRMETGDRLRKSGVPVTEFQAGIIIGSGSLAFELIRYVTERIPLLIAPRWVKTRTQPIAIRSVLQYLTSALDVEESTGKIIQIGGEKIYTYADLFRAYAEVRRLRRVFISLPIKSPRLSALWVGLVTPIGGAGVRRMIERMESEMVVSDDLAKRLFNVQHISYREAVRRALIRFERDEVDTTWTDAASTSQAGTGKMEKLGRQEGLVKWRVRAYTDADPDSVFSVISSLGGETGWLYANALWKLRGLIDLLTGGIGLRKARRTYSQLRVGDTVDFWRVEAVEKGRLLRLRAEMKVSGQAWLQYDLSRSGAGGTRVTQTAFFEPRGLVGFLYWYCFYLPHLFIFPGMLREIVRRAEVVDAESVE